MQVRMRAVEVQDSGFHVVLHSLCLQQSLSISENSVSIFKCHKVAYKTQPSIWIVFLKIN